jgi:hypothetical protein
MDRVQQGLEHRYVERGIKSISPSLDVYRFIWGRTQMVRKDNATLQIIVETGGQCSATAVRSCMNASHDGMPFNNIS